MIFDQRIIHLVYESQILNDKLSESSCEQQTVFRCEKTIFNRK